MLCYLGNDLVHNVMLYRGAASSVEWDVDRWAVNAATAAAVSSIRYVVTLRRAFPFIVQVQWRNAFSRLLLLTSGKVLGRCGLKKSVRVSQNVTCSKAVSWPLKRIQKLVASPSTSFEWIRTTAFLQLCSCTCRFTIRWAVCLYGMEETEKRKNSELAWFKKKR